MRRLLFSLLCLSFALPVSAQTPTPVTGAALLPGDVVSVDIWREPDLSGQFIIDEDGEVTLPLLGTLLVTGIDTGELRDQLIEQYNEYLVNTSVNVVLLRRVNVLGEVRMPGQYTVDATQSVADLIARAQGITQEANADDIRLLRGGQVTRANLNGTLTLNSAGIRSGDQIFVGRRSWLSRNFQSLVGIGTIIANVAVIVTR